MHGVFLDLDSVDRGDLDLEPISSVLGKWTAYPETDREDVRQRIQGAEIVISNKTGLGNDDLQSAENLKLVCVAATGTNNIDLEAARRCDITVCNVATYATPSVVEHVFSQLLTLVRHLDEYREAVTRGHWQRSRTFCLLNYPIRELAGMTLGIIGYGELGQAVAAMGKAFGMHILVAERAGKPPRTGRTLLDEVLKTADIVSLHCPLNQETHNLIGARELGLMQRDALLVNTARGGIVDEKALLHSLQTRGIAGAAVDVLSKEPPRHGNPLLDTGLRGQVDPSAAPWPSIKSRQRLIDQVADNITAWQAGNPRNVICPQPDTDG